MTENIKLKVYQSQYDEIEAAVWHMKDGRKWLDENLEIAKYEFPPDFKWPHLYVFFGPEERMEEWRIRNGHETRDVKHALAFNSIEGLRGIPVRVYDIDGDKTWYHENYWQYALKRTLYALDNMRASCATIERLE